MKTSSISSAGALLRDQGHYTQFLHHNLTAFYCLVLTHCCPQASQPFLFLSCIELLQKAKQNGNRKKGIIDRNLFSFLWVILQSSTLGRMNWNSPDLNIFVFVMLVEVCSMLLVAHLRFVLHSRNLQPSAFWHVLCWARGFGCDCRAWM